MTHRRDLELHRLKLEEMRDIMNSMKALAYMESRKLASFIDARRNIVTTIEHAAADLLHFYPQPAATTADTLFIAIGSERGFCGDFNERLLQALPAATQHPLIAVGHKLHGLMPPEQYPQCITIDGASTAEEVDKTLGRLVDTLLDLLQEQPLTSVTIAYHEAPYGEPVLKPLLPPFQALAANPSPSGNPPWLTLTPQACFQALVDEYLYAVLNTTLCSALLAENTLRTQHLENAVNHLEEKSTLLRQKGNALRQEEITEEIEIILLNAGLG